jgi:hypothetical protein
LISSWLADIDPCMYGRATLAMVLSSDCISVASTVQIVTMVRVAVLIGGARGGVSVVTRPRPARR